MCFEWNLISQPIKNVTQCVWWICSWLQTAAALRASRAATCQLNCLPSLTPKMYLGIWIATATAHFNLIYARNERERERARIKKKTKQKQNEAEAKCKSKLIMHINFCRRTAKRVARPLSPVPHSSADQHKPRLSWPQNNSNKSSRKKAKNDRATRQCPLLGPSGCAP